MSTNWTLHPHDYGTWMRIMEVAFEAASTLGLELKDIAPADDEILMNRVSARHGDCSSGGKIRIVLRHKNIETGEWLGPRPMAEVWETLAHELAHLAYMHHGKAFWNYLERRARPVVDDLRWKRKL